jgi:hypothetical protein
MMAVNTGELLECLYAYAEWDACGGFEELNRECQQQTTRPTRMHVLYRV